MTAISAGPCRTTCGRSVVVTVIAILYPLPHISGHIVETESVGWERSDRRGLTVGRAAAVKAESVRFADRVAPVIGRGGAGAGRVFPFGLGKQTVGLAGHYRTARPRIVVRHPNRH